MPDDSSRSGTLWFRQTSRLLSRWSPARSAGILPGLHRRLFVDNVEALLANMIEDAADHPVRIGFLDQPDIDRCRRGFRNDRASLRTDISAAKTADIQRWVLQRFLQTAADF